MNNLKRLLLFGLGVGILLCGCSKPDKPTPQDVPPVVEEPETSPPAPPSPPVEQGNCNPLTGMYDGIPGSALDMRPVAIMVSNSYDSLPQWGISQADIIYEMLAEGRITRFVTLFQDYTKIEKLASIRSSRPYFIDIAQSYGAVYIHCGGSVPAYNAIKSRRDLISFDGIKGPGSGEFERDPQRKKDLGSEHSVFLTGTKVGNILKQTDKALTLEGAPSAFQFAPVSSAANGSAASKVTLHYSDRHTPYYTYDSDAKTYLRFQYGEKHMDAYFNKQVEVKNLLVLYMDTESVPNNSLHLVDIDTTGSGTGYYFCEGKYIPIKWEKQSYNSPINYTTESGDALVCCPGQTFVSVVISGSKVDIE